MLTVKRSPPFRMYVSFFDDHCDCGLMPFFNAYVIRPENPAGWLATFLGAYFGAGFLCMPAWLWLARRVGKRPAWLLSFGIATSYRQMNQAKVHTCTRNPDVRLLFVGVALVLRNVWVWLHHQALATPRRGGRVLRLERLGFKKEGHLRERWIVAGEVSDSDLYGVLASDWHARGGQVADVGT